MLPSIDDIRSYQEFLKQYLTPTPLYQSPQLSHLLGCNLFVKVETMSPIASFKARGTISALASLRKNGAEHVVTASTGNFGQGVALAGKIFDMETTVYVPKNPNPDKVASMKLLGAKVVAVGDDLDMSKEEGKKWAKGNDFVFLEDGDNTDIIKGTATIGLEILEKIDNIDTIIIPVGNGALINGIAYVLKSHSKKIQIIGVVAEGAPSMYLSWKSGLAEETEEMKTFAEGIAVRVSIQSSVDLLRQFVDEIILVSDKEMGNAIKEIIDTTHILTEPAAASTLAAAKKITDNLKGKNVVLVLTGSNLSRNQLLNILKL